jgi:hypothetical protein
MKATINDFYTDILLTKKEVKVLCRPGEGSDTCIWLLLSSKGFECCQCHKPIPLMINFELGRTVAKRNGCEAMEKFDPAQFGVGVIEFDLLK